MLRDMGIRFQTAKVIFKVTQGQWYRYHLPFDRPPINLQW